MTPSDEALRLAQTPGTDDVACSGEDITKRFAAGSNRDYVPAYFARTLERELNALRAELEQLSARAIEEVLKREQAEAKAKEYSAKCHHHLAMRQGAESLAERLRAELETAHEALRRMEFDAAEKRAKER